MITNSQTNNTGERIDSFRDDGPEVIRSLEGAKAVGIICLVFTLITVGLAVISGLGSLIPSSKGNRPFQTLVQLILMIQLLLTPTIVFLGILGFYLSGVIRRGLFNGFMVLLSISFFLLMTLAGLIVTLKTDRMLFRLVLFMLIVELIVFSIPLAIASYSANQVSIFSCLAPLIPPLVAFVAFVITAQWRESVLGFTFYFAAVSLSSGLLGLIALRKAWRT